MYSVAQPRKLVPDRFIPLRMNVNLDLNKKPVLEVAYFDFKEDFINCAKVRYNKWKYQNTLRNAMFPLQTKVLNFFPPKQYTTEPFISSSETWPVKPRLKPVIESPEMVLDMPQFDSDLCHHITDWSSQNCLAVIFEKEVHMWFTHSDFYRTKTKTGMRVQNCIKWAKDGTRFGISLSPNKFGIWSTENKKIIFESSCCTLECEILCLEWLGPNLLITGCRNGCLNLFTSKLTKLRVQKSTKYDIVNIVSSCDKKFCAVSTTNHVVYVWKIPQLECHLKIKSNSIVRALAWHPWRSSLLAMGAGDTDGTVSIWNISSQKEIAREKTTYTNCRLDALSFNPITAELVASYFVKVEAYNKGMSVISVFTNIDSVIEELILQDAPILYLLWGNEGKVLASASGDETICLWDFFGPKSQLKPKKKEDTFERKLALAFPSIR